VETAAIREALKDLTFDKAPQGPVKMRGLDNQIVVPSYLMKVREGWTSVNDMFEEIKSVPSVEPKDARCDLPLK
jgi:urea transport system substrate-binding protein